MVILRVLETSIEEMSNWLNKFFEKVGIQKKFFLIGHSQGCLVGLEFFKKFIKNEKINIYCWFIFYSG